MQAALLALGLAAAAGAQAGPREFVYKDWAAACDNTRHCELVGYQSLEQDAPVSLWMGRDAGANAPLQARLMAYSDDDQAEAGPLSIRVGEVSVTTGGSDDALTAEQIGRLLPAMKQADSAQVTDGQHQWELSLAGLNAALLKIDEVQGRIGTVTALARPGPRPASAVPAAVPAPGWRAAPLPKPRPGDQALLGAILPALRGEDCETEPTEHGAAIYRVSASQVLVVRQCWLGAYQGSYSVWRANDKPPYAPVRMKLPDLDGKDLEAAVEAYFENGVLSSYAKGRGIGDCGSADSWLWTADGFKLLASSNGPLCRGMPGGGFMLRQWTARQLR